MTSDPDKEDTQWLNALAGKVDHDADSKLNQQAESLRRALRARSDLLASHVPVADDAQYQQMLFRLRREGLASSSHGWRNPMLWGMAATIVMGIGVVIQMGNFDSDGYEKDILRGAEHATALIVTNPEARLVELQAGLQIAGEVPKIDRLANGSIVLTVKATEKVLAYLLTQRLEPEVSGGNSILKLTPTKPIK
jgi:hypothetical protein